MSQHRPINLRQNVVANFDHQIGPNAKNVAVECGVMQLAHRKPVRNDRFSHRVAVRKDVGCIQQLCMPQAAYGAAFAICAKDVLPERDLMKPLASKTSDVLPTRLVDDIWTKVGPDHPRVIEFY